MTTPELEAIRTAAVDYIRTAYRAWHLDRREGSQRREPVITAEHVTHYLLQHAAGKPLTWISTASARTTVRNLLEGLRHSGVLSSSTASDSRGRDVRAYEDVR